MESPARELSRGLAENVEAVCKHYLSNGRRTGNYWIVGDVNNHAGRSLFVRLKGPLTGKGARGKWTDAASGEHGDLLDLIAAREGYDSIGGALDEARRFLRAPRATLTERCNENSRECDTIALARKIWAASAPIAGTKAEAYLRARKITADLIDAPLRYHPALVYREDRNSSSRKLPALLAAVTNHDGEITGIHRTFLNPACNAKADVFSPRRSLGAILRNGVCFGVVDDFAIIGEGIETVLSLKSVLPDAPMVAALSAAHLAAWKIPAGLRRMVIAADNDRAGRNAARKLAGRAEAAGIDVEMIVARGEDFNSDLRDGSSERLRRQLASSIS
ncbi:MAG: toprim domain-containing protein [Methylocystis sp.]